ncbi:MAG: hypothetical protein QGH60_09410 [Phycisphaerae bacterium]|jgi:hypothetical protein|nr:hypothetical protein [Phycisphaerae bacterium]
MRRRIPTINLLIIAVIVMMVCIPMVFFRFRMMMANKVGIFLILGLVIVIGVLARMGGDHKARRLAEEKRRKQLTDGKSGRKQK